MITIPWFLFALPWLLIFILLIYIIGLRAGISLMRQRSGQFDRNY